MMIQHRFFIASELRISQTDDRFDRLSDGSQTSKSDFKHQGLTMFLNFSNQK
jgi:hypothetical protein